MRALLGLVAFLAFAVAVIGLLGVYGVWQSGGGWTDAKPPLIAFGGGCTVSLLAAAALRALGGRR